MRMTLTPEVVQEVSWGRDQGDIGRVKFKVGEERGLRWLSNLDYFQRRK
jgi:hypothetical protein